MLISTQTEKFCLRLGEKEGVRVLCESGYDALDYSMFRMHEDDYILCSDSYKSHAKELRTIAEGCGKFFNQTHAPFASMKDGDDEYNGKMFPKLVRAIEITGIIGAKACVVHPVQFAENQFEKNIELYLKLLPYAKDAGVKIALENMWGSSNGKIVPNVCSTAEDFPVYVDALDPEYFTACLDLGHCGLVGDNAPNMIRALGGKRLNHLHVHDNDNKRDLHFPPFTFYMEWDLIARALAEIGYSGEITLEADGILQNVPADILPSAAKYMSASARKLADMTESYSAE